MINAMVLCAGFGTRLRPLTDKLPKPLVPLCGLPLLRFNFALLKNAGVRDLVVNTHHLAAEMEKGAREIAATGAYVTSRRERKKVEMLFAHLKRILKLDRLRLRGPCGARDEFHLAVTAQNLRKLAKLIPAPEPILAA